MQTITSVDRNVFMCTGISTSRCHKQESTQHTPHTKPVRSSHSTSSTHLFSIANCQRQVKVWRHQHAPAVPQSLEVSQFLKQPLQRDNSESQSFKGMPRDSIAENEAKRRA